jgi:cupin fold WbuC family metalloprotein
MIAAPVPPAALRRENDEVFYSDEPVVTLEPAVLGFLKAQAARNSRLRSRLCAHPDPSARVHEMLIVHHHDVYVRPHQHLAKSESFHLMEGRALIVLFAGDGGIERVIPVGEPGSGRAAYFRMPERVVHGFVIESEWLVFHETTAGPFDPSGTACAPWAPADGDPAAAPYLADLRARARLRLTEGKTAR